MTQTFEMQTWLVDLWGKGKYLLFEVELDPFPAVFCEIIQLKKYSIKAVSI